MVFHGLLGTCSFFENNLCLCVLEDFGLLYGNSYISPQECDKVFFKIVLKMCKCEKVVLEQVPNRYLPTQKRMFFSSFPLDSAILILVSR